MAGGAAGAIQASTLVYSDDFSAGTIRADYTQSLGGNAVSTTAGYLNISDTNSSSAILTLTADKFSAFTLNAGDQVIVSADIRVNSASFGSGISVPRLSVFNGNATAGYEAFTVGFGTGSSAASVGTTPIGFYIGTTAGGNAASMVAGPGNFGVYSSTASANNTDGGDGLLFYRVAFTLTQGSNVVTGLITELGGQNLIASFSGNATGALNWSNAATNGLRITTGAGGLSNVDFDNLSVTVVPEPSTYGLLGAGALAGAALVRRRRSR